VKCFVDDSKLYLYYCICAESAHADGLLSTICAVDTVSLLHNISICDTTVTLFPTGF
jgi:hypothetical protein